MGMLCASCKPQHAGCWISITAASSAPPSDAGKERCILRVKKTYFGLYVWLTYPLTDGVVFDGQLVALSSALSQQVLNARQLLLQDAVLLLEGQQRGHGLGDGTYRRGQGSGHRLNFAALLLWLQTPHPSVQQLLCAIAKAAALLQIRACTNRSFAITAARQILSLQRQTISAAAGSSYLSPARSWVPPPLCFAFSSPASPSRSALLGLCFRSASGKRMHGWD